VIVTRKKAKELLGDEAISKPKFYGKRWFLLSRSSPHRNLGGFRTKGEAQEHERAVQYFKRANPGEAAMVKKNPVGQATAQRLYQDLGAKQARLREAIMAEPGDYVRAYKLGDKSSRVETAARADAKRISRLISSLVGLREDLRLGDMDPSSSSMPDLFPREARALEDKLRIFSRVLDKQSYNVLSMNARQLRGKRDVEIPAYAGKRKGLMGIFRKNPSQDKPERNMRKKLRKTASGEIISRPKLKSVRREACLGSKGIKDAVESGKLVFLDTLIFPQPQVTGVAIKHYRDRTGPGADYYGLLKLDNGKTDRLDGLKRTRVIIIDEAQANPMMTTADAAGRTMTVFKLSAPEKKLLERRGVDPWDLIGQRPESLQRMISGLQASERPDVVGAGHTVFSTASGPQSVPASLQMLVGSTVKGWTVKELKSGAGMLPLNARLEREIQGAKIKLRIVPIGKDPTQQLIIIRTGASQAVAKLIRANRGSSYAMEDVQKVLTRAADEATKWMSGKGKGWRAAPSEALPNPKKKADYRFPNPTPRKGSKMPSKKELFTFWAQEYDAELQDDARRREAARELGEAKEDILTFLFVTEPGQKKEPVKVKVLIEALKSKYSPETIILAMRELISGDLIKKHGDARSAKLSLTPLGNRYAINLYKRLETMMLRSEVALDGLAAGPGDDYEPRFNPGKRPKKVARKKKPSFGIFDSFLHAHMRSLKERTKGKIKKDLKDLDDRGIDHIDQARAEAILTVYTKRYLEDLAKLTEDAIAKNAIKRMAVDTRASGLSRDNAFFFAQSLVEGSRVKDRAVMSAAFYASRPIYTDFDPRAAAEIIAESFPGQAPNFFERRAKDLLSLMKSARAKSNPKTKPKNKAKNKSHSKNPTRKRPFAWDKDRIAKSPFKSKAAAQRAETLHKMGEGIGSTQAASLKAMGRLPRSHGGYELGKKYR